MSNTKISLLPASTTPLAGTEVLPIVQSSATKQVSVANLTTGRAVSAASLSLTTTPLSVTSGGTGLASFTVNGVVYASSTSALATGTTLAFDGVNFSVGAAWTTNPMRSAQPQFFQYGAASTGLVIAADGAAFFQAIRFSTNASGTNLILSKGRGTYASPTAVASGDYIGSLDFRAYGGTSSRTLSQINGQVDTYTSDTNISSNLTFATSSSGAASATEKMKIDQGGNIYGTSGTTGMTDGFFYIPSAGGAPSGTPTAVSGRVPMYYDTTNNKFYIYNGAWKSVALT